MEVLSVQVNVHFSDLVADGVIDNKDKDVIGNPNPDVFGNFGTSCITKIGHWMPFSVIHWGMTFTIINVPYWKAEILIIIRPQLC